ncbi:MAG: hypothetical protein NT013_24440, partial [Planctomycetia bacterium]|nr:hypothetical protein [Planctomycetia bacterium]
STGELVWASVRNSNQARSFFPSTDVTAASITGSIRVRTASPQAASASFGFLRGVKDRAAMLELRLKDGNSVAFDYGWLRKVEFNPSEGITLHFGGTDTVRITGRNLNRPNAQLLRGIHAHRVPWIQEASEPDILKAADDATVIEQIVFPTASR